MTKQTTIVVIGALRFNACDGKRNEMYRAEVLCNLKSKKNVPLKSEISISDSYNNLSSSDKLPTLSFRST